MLSDYFATRDDFLEVISPPFMFSVNVYFFAPLYAYYAIPLPI